MALEFGGCQRPFLMGEWRFKLFKKMLEHLFVLGGWRFRILRSSFLGLLGSRSWVGCGIHVAFSLLDFVKRNGGHYSYDALQSI